MPHARKGGAALRACLLAPGVQAAAGCCWEDGPASHDEHTEGPRERHLHVCRRFPEQRLAGTWREGRGGRGEGGAGKREAVCVMVVGGGEPAGGAQVEGLVMLLARLVSSLFLPQEHLLAACLPACH